MCFGGGGNNNSAPPPPPPTNVPAPPGSDSFQRFQEIRKGLLTGDTQLIQPASSDKLGVSKGSNVTTQV